MDQSYRFSDGQHDGHQTLHDVCLVGKVRLAETQLPIVIRSEHVDMLAIIRITAQHYCVGVAKCDLSDMLERKVHTNRNVP